jgi:ferredoxin
MKEAEMSLIIDYRKCRKAHQCCYLHPELFKADEVDAPVVLVDHPGGELRGAAEEAVELCPNGAISFREKS